MAANQNHLMPCPYDPNNPNHASLPGTFGYHLVRCRASIVANKDDPRRPRVLKLTKCQYNNTHIVLKTELEEHHKSCPAKIDTDVEDITERIRRNLQASKNREWERGNSAAATAAAEKWDLENGNTDHSPLHAIANSEAALAKAEGKIVGDAGKCAGETSETPAAAASYIPGLGGQGALTKNQKKKAKRKAKKAEQN